MCVLHVGMKQISFVLVVLQIYVATGLSCPLDSSSRLPDTPCCWPAGINIPFLPPSGTLAFPLCNIVQCVFVLTLQCCISWYKVFSKTLFLWVGSFLFLQQDYVINFFCIFDICVCCGHRNETRNVICVLCDTVVKWMKVTTLKKTHLQRVNALCRLCGRRSNKAFDVQKVLLCKIMPLNCMLFIKWIFHLTQHPNSDILCRPCYTCLMRLKCSKVPSYFTLQAAKG